jgi:hypothetical protein
VLAKGAKHLPKAVGAGLIEAETASDLAPLVLESQGWHIVRLGRLW